MGYFDALPEIGSTAQSPTVSPASTGEYFKLPEIKDSPSVIQAPLSTIPAPKISGQAALTPVKITQPDTSSLFPKTTSFINSFSAPSVSSTPSGVKDTQIKVAPDYGTGTGAPTSLSSAPKENLWDKVINPIKDTLFGEDPRVSHIQSTIVDSNLLDIGKQLGIDKQIPINTTNPDKGVQQINHDKAITDYVRNNYDSIRASFPKSENLPVHPDMLSPGFSDVSKNIESYTKSLGLPYNPTNAEKVTNLLMLPVGAALLDNPVTVVGLGVYTALGAAEHAILGDSIAGKVADFAGLNNNSRDVLNLIEMFATGALLHSAYKAMPDVATKWTKDITTQYMPGKSIRFDPAQIHAALSGGAERGEISKEEVSLINSVVGKGGAMAWKNAIKNGATIDVAPEKVISIADKPYWSKIKSTLGISTDPNVQKTPLGESKIGAESRTSRLLGSGEKTLKNGADILDNETASHIQEHGASATAQAMQEKLGSTPDHVVSTIARNKIKNPEDILAQAKGSEVGTPSNSISLITDTGKGDHLPSLSKKAATATPSSYSSLYSTSPSLKDFDSISSYVTTSIKESKENEKPFIEQIEKVTGITPETRIKSEESITGKADRLAARGKDYTTTHDILAGRIIVPANEVSEKIKQIQDNFKVVSVADHRTLDSPYGYFGVNMRVELPNGLKAEIQVHTPHSLGHSLSTHPLYEKFRNTPETRMTKEQLDIKKQDIKTARELADKMRKADKAKTKEKVTEVTSKDESPINTKNSLRGFVDFEAPIKAANNHVKDFVEKTMKPTLLSDNLSESFYKLEGASQADLEMVQNLIKGLDITKEDDEALYKHAEDPTFKLTSKQQELYEKIDEPFKKLNQSLFEAIKNDGMPLPESDMYISRFPKEKPSVMQRIFNPAEGRASTSGQGGVLSKSANSLKGRTMKALTDTEGKRTVVSVKDGEVTAFVNKETSSLGHLKAKITPKVKEFNDAETMPVLEKLAENIGIKHVRATGKEKGLGGNRAGVSFQGQNLVKTRAGSPERVLLHEIGHQLDHRYNLKALFNDKVLPLSRQPVDSFLGGEYYQEHDMSAHDQALHEAQGRLEMYQSQYDQGIDIYRRLIKYIQGKEGLGEVGASKTANGRRLQGGAKIWAEKGDDILDELGFSAKAGNASEVGGREEANAFLEEFKNNVIPGLRAAKKEYALANKEKRANDMQNAFLEKNASETDKMVSRQKKPATTYDAKAELRAVADLRLPRSGNYTKSFKSYVRNSDEKMAAMFEAYIHIPDQFEKVAPNTYAKFEEFLQSHSELHPILDLNPSIVLQGRKLGGEHVGGLNGGTFIDSTGKKYTIGEATTEEIEKHTNLTYHHSAIASRVMQYIKLRQIDRANKFIESWKESPEFAQIAIPSDQIPPEGWKMTSQQNFRNYYFEPHVAEILDDMQRKMDSRMYNDAFSGVNRALADAIFFNGLAHPINVAVTWAYNRGISSLVLPSRYKSGLKAFSRALDAMNTKNDDYMELLRNGAHLMSSDVTTKTLAENLMKKLGDDLKKNKGLEEKILDAFGYAGKQATFKGNVIYKLSHDMAWLSNDLLTMQSIFEAMDTKGLSMEEAIRQTDRFIPNYRKDSRLLDKPLSFAMGQNVGGATSRKIAQIMYNPEISMFGAYHVGLFKSLKNSIADTFNAGEGFDKEANKTRAEGLDKLAMLALLGLVVFPFLDRQAQKVTGDPDTYITRSGILKYPYLAYKALTGQATGPQVASGIITPAVGTQTALELAFNRNFFTGNHIYGIGGEGLPGYLGSKVAPIAEVQRVAKGNATPGEIAGTLLGAHTPKNSQQGIDLNALIYDEKPRVLKEVKTHLLSDDKEGALSLVKDFNNRLKAAIKAADIKEGNSGSDARVQYFLNKDGMRMPTDKAMANFKSVQGQNIVQKTLPSGKPVITKNEPLPATGVIGAVLTYAKALSIDPVTAFKDIFTGQVIRDVRNGTVIVQRMGLSDSQAVKTARGGNNTGMKLDHTIPLQLGGDNSEGNLKLVPTDTWASYTPIENLLGKALDSGKIDKKTAQSLITRFKNQEITADQIRTIIDK